MRGMACVLLMWCSVIGGCSVIDPGLIQVDGSTDARSDAADASVDAVEDAPDPDVPTGLRKPPARPSMPDSADTDPMTIALRDVVLNQSGLRWREIGLDLDDLDTQSPADSVECVPPNMDAEVELDGVQGIDNAFGDKLYPIVALALPTLEADARSNQEAGLGAILLQMQGWNGTANDPRVDIFLTQSAAGTTTDPGSVTFDGFDPMVGGSAAPPPAWEGNDHWFGRDDTFFMGDVSQPIIRDDNAYIADGTIVMRLPDRIDILFFVGTDMGVRVRLTDAFAFGQFNEDFTRLEPATVAGRWSIIDLLDTGENINICVGSVQRMIIENQLDTIADVRSNAGSGGPGVLCDAISLGVSFVGVRANWGGLGPSRPLPNPCE